ncbi:hypothetical protein PRUPE_6G347900 [Prunus persica]|uniref:Uncharacterized protein n=1 Tax=Prunus persica TaxID=3760 RepID=A0A251P000_PRUPE|nr:hypothetical protein PRUPE_6G347900 [Prunus persica]
MELRKRKTGPQRLEELSNPRKIKLDMDAFGVSSTPGALFLMASTSSAKKKNNPADSSSLRQVTVSSAHDVVVALETRDERKFSFRVPETVNDGDYMSIRSQIHTCNACYQRNDVIATNPRDLTPPPPPAEDLPPYQHFRIM